jgi:hypothetical protein
MPLGNRIMILAWSLVMITMGSCGILAQNGPMADRSWVPALWIIAGMGFLLLGVFGYRPKNSARLAKEPVPEDWPSKEVRSRMVIQERVGLTGDLVRVMVDPVARRIYVENGHYTNKSIPWAQKYYQCSLDEISIPHGLGDQNIRDGIARITTPDGWFWATMRIMCKSRDEARDLLKANAGFGRIQRTLDNQFYIDIRDYLRSLGVPDGAPDDQHMQVLFLGGLCGVVAGMVGVWNTRPGESNWIECLRFVAGFSLGAAGVFSIVWLGERAPSQTDSHWSQSG